MWISGKIVSGLKKAHEFMCNEIYSKEFARLLGFAPFCGTLNIEINKKNLELIKSLDSNKFLEIKEFEFSGKEFCKVKLVKAKLVHASFSFPCAIIFPEKTSHPENILEVIAEENLREKMKLNEGDIVSVEL